MYNVKSLEESKTIIATDIIETKAMVFIKTAFNRTVFFYANMNYIMKILFRSCNLSCGSISSCWNQMNDRDREENERK